MTLVNDHKYSAGARITCPLRRFWTVHVGPDRFNTQDTGDIEALQSCCGCLGRCRRLRTMGTLGSLQTLRLLWLLRGFIPQGVVGTQRAAENKLLAHAVSA